MNLTKADIGKKFKNRKGMVVELMATSCEEVPFYTFSPYHGIKPNGKSCIGHDDFDIVERVEADPKEDPSTNGRRSGLSRAFPNAVSVEADPKEDPSTWEAGDILECVSDKLFGDAYPRKPWIGERYTVENVGRGWVTAKGVWGTNKIRGLWVCAWLNFKLVSKAAELNHSDIHRVISVNGPEFLPVGTYIKFVRDSRSGRYYKGELARVVDHGKKSMCVHKIGSAEGVFLPPDRSDIYEVVKV